MLNFNDFLSDFFKSPRDDKFAKLTSSHKVIGMICMTATVKPEGHDCTLDTFLLEKYMSIRDFVVASDEPEVAIIDNALKAMRMHLKNYEKDRSGADILFKHFQSHLINRTSYVDTEKIYKKCPGNVR